MVPHSPQFGILLVAFGAFSTKAEQPLLDFANQVQANYPSLPIYWAFAAPFAPPQNSITTFSVSQALQQMHKNGITHVAIQPLYLIAGCEYEGIVADALRAQTEYSLTIFVGQPLMHATCNMHFIANALLADVPHARQPDEAVIFVGHGTPHPEDDQYTLLAQKLTQLDPLAFLGTLKGAAQKNALLPIMMECRAKKVWLIPLLVSIGNHAQLDIAGNAPHSWRSYFEANNIACETHLHGVSENAHCTAMWHNNLHFTMQQLQLNAG